MPPPDFSFTKETSDFWPTKVFISAEAHIRQEGKASRAASFFVRFLSGPGGYPGKKLACQVGHNIRKLAKIDYIIDRLIEEMWKKGRKKCVFLPHMN